MRSPITQIAIADSTSHDLSLAGDGDVGDPFVITSATILDPAAGNLASLSAAGLMVAADAGYNVADSATIDLTLSGTGTTADPWALSGEVVNNSIDTAHIAPDAVTSGELADDAVGAEHLAASVVSVLVPNMLAQDGTGALRSESLVDLSYNAANGQFTFVDAYGTASIIDTALESIILASAFDAVTYDLSLTMSDGNVITANLGGLVDTYALAVTNGATISLGLTGDGSTATPWDVTAEIAAGSVDTVYLTNAAVTAAKIAPGAAVVGVIDTATVDLAMSAVGDLTADVNVSTAAGNIITTNATGVYASAPIDSVSDTATVDLTLDIAGDLTGDINLSALGGNALSAQPDGLYSPIYALNTSGSTSVSLVLSGAGTTAAPWSIAANTIIDPAAANMLTAGASGLSVTLGSIDAMSDVDTTTATPLAGDALVWDGANFVPTALPSSEATSVSDTATVDLTLTGTDITADVKVSTTAGNIITSDATGVYAPTPAAAAPSTVSDTATVDLTLTGLDITADVKVSTTAGNIITSDATGVYATTPAATPTTVSDTTTVDLTLVGADITADVKFSATADNKAIDDGSGIYVEPAALSIADSATIDLTLNGLGSSVSPWSLSASAIVDPAAGNLLAASAAGLSVILGSIGTLTDVDTTTVAPVVGQALVWDGTNFVPTAIAAGGAEATTVSDTATIDLILTGTNITANVNNGSITVAKLDAGIGLDDLDGARIAADVNLGGFKAINAADGVAATDLATVGQLPAPSTVSDTATVDLTLTGLDITADVKVSTAAGNDLTANATGLFVDVPVKSAVDSNDIDLTLSAAGALTAAAVIDPAASNTLTSSAAGLLVEVDIADLTGVDLTGLANGDHLAWNTATSNFEPVAPTAAGAEATTVSNTPTINLALTGADITANVNDGSITVAKLDVNIGLDDLDGARIAADVNLGGFKAINAADGVAATDLATVGQLRQRERLDWSYDSFCVAPTGVPAKVVMRPATLDYIGVGAVNGPIGGDETWELFVNGAGSGVTVTLSVGGTSAQTLNGALVIAQGSIVEMRPTATTAATGSEFGSATITINEQV